MQEIQRQRDEYKERQAERLWKESNVGRRFENATFEAYTGDLKALNVCRQWVKSHERGSGLVLCGSYGVGKTHLATATAREAMRKYGYTIWVQSFAGMLQELKNAYGNSARAEMSLRRYKTVDLLVVDDLGKESMTAWSSEMLYMIVDERYRNMRSMIITTNLMPNELGKHIDGALMSRLAEMCKFIKVTGEDYRLRKESK